MKRLTGIVVKTNNSKTAHVEVKNDWMHPKYLKKKTVSHVFACHDEIGTHVGDQVEIVETRPLSATKYFKVDTVVKAATLIEKAVVKKVVKTSKKKVAKKN